MIDWYFPWGRIDWVLRLQLIVWLASVVIAYWISWRYLIAKRPWLKKGNKQDAP
jgi:hypothetical protein